MKIDVTTGDKITYREIEYSFELMLENRKIHVWSYNVETVLAEKFEAIIKRGVLGTRIRDFYDVHMLLKTQTKNINKKTLKVAIQFTAEHRGSEEAIKEWKDVLKELEDDETMKNQWKRYQKNNFYAEGIEYEDLMKSIKEVGEDDIDDAPVMLTIKTGSEIVMYISIALGTILIVTTGIIVIKKKVLVD